MTNCKIVMKVVDFDLERQRTGSVLAVFEELRDGSSGRQQMAEDWVNPRQQIQWPIEREES